MRLEHCIRRWLGLAAHRVQRVEENDDCLIAEIEAIEGHLPRCGCCGRKVGRTKGRTRRRLWRDLKIRKLRGPTKALIKGTRFVLLKNPWNLTPKQKRSLSSLVRSNHPLARACYLKEDFQRFWDHLHETWAWRHLDQWLWWASHSRLEPFKVFAKMIRKHKAGILAWTKLRISNGMLEGMNNKVTLVSHRSYGFRNDDRHIEAIYHDCAGLPLPPDS